MTASSNQLALLGGKPVGKVEFPRFPVFRPSAIKRVTRLMEQGEMVGLVRFHKPIRIAEEAISEYHGGRHALALSSGHASLQMSLAGLEVGPGDEVITTPYTWGASISCILHQNAIPVFTDVDPLTGLMDPDTIESRITKKTKAILVVHIYGQPANMTAICKIAKKHGLAVIEDGSQAHGALWKNKVVGNWGDAAGFSCMAGKILGTGEGGYMVTEREDVRWRACLYCQHKGRSQEEGFPDEFRPYVDSLQYTYRINTMVAILIAEQLKKLDQEGVVRRANVAHLRDCLADSKFLKLPNYGKDAVPAWHFMTANVRVEQAGVSRDTFEKALRAEGMPCNHYVPAPITDWYRLNWREYRGPRPMWIDNLRRAGVDYAKTEVPNCRIKCDRSLEFGTNNFIQPAKAEMERVAEIVHKVEKHIDALRQWERAEHGAVAA